jgi:D-alanyl-D-alanine carboxypeptidase/D-alanyl-D-alanine-endopeptidase (penicillin-binding protein 4)
VDGLLRSDEKDHPFPAALRAMAAREDEGSEYARSLLSLLPSPKRAPQSP